jgi:uncharacterized heparinase superfamily protein
MNIPRLWRTVRWLRPIQVARRGWRLVQRPKPTLHAPPPVRIRVGEFVLPARRISSLLGPSTMRFLGEARDVAALGWDNPEVPLLWRYNQHYFDDLAAADAPARVQWHAALLDDWVRSNPPGRGAAWEPYPTSLRIVNWIKGWSAPDAALAPTPAWVQSLAVQARWLARNLEWHLLGNHLFANAKALVYAGLFFDGAEADQWLRTGQAILLRELPEQLLPDGGHFERSPMYHALVLEDVLDLLNVTTVYGLPITQPMLQRLAERVPAMVQWLHAMTRPDGSLCRFNDCADDIAPPPHELLRYAAALGVETGMRDTTGSVVALANSGYLRLHAAGATAWLDLAPIGPDYLPGHAHADTLSMELALHGYPLLVNRGTSEYGTGPRRQLERGTPAHNTVTVAGENSSEVWAGFRVGRRARVRDLRYQQEGEVTTVSAWHTGYQHLPGAPRHQRCWQWQPGTLSVTDTVTGSHRFARWHPTGPATVARYHLAPGYALQHQGADWLVTNAAGVVATVQVTRGMATVEPWQHAQGFGELRDAVTLAVTMVPNDNGEELQVQVTWRWHPR